MVSGLKVPGLPGLRPHGVECAARGPQPAPGEFALRQACRHLALAEARSLDGDVRAHVLEDDDPVGVVLVERRPER